MDRLVVETQEKKEEQPTPQPAPQAEVETETLQKQEEKVAVAAEEAPNASSAYVNSFENLTVADIKREEEQKEAEKFKAEKEELLKKQFEPVQEVSKPVEEEKQQEKQQEKSVNIIEKPNYDLIENKKVLHIQTKKASKKSTKKVAGIVLACALGAASVVCVANTIVIDQMNASYVNVDETYNFNLAQYLKHLSQLDSTKQSMEIVETYPEEMNDAGDFGEKSNWFDRVCKFLGGLFGG